MSSFLNTEQTYSNSGTAGLWLTANTAFSSVRNSGGVVSVPGPVLVKSIYVVYASGQSTAPSESGMIITVNNAISGMAAVLSGADTLYNYAPGAQSGLVNGLALVPLSTPLGPMDFLCRSGLVTNNAGTHVFDLIVTYSLKQA
jgi:hypothetical protein